MKVHSKQITIYIILASLTLIFPLLFAFRGFPEIYFGSDFGLTKLLRYLALVMSLLCLIIINFRVKNELFLYSFSVTTLLILNYMLSDYASLKWLFNWVACIVIFTSVGSVIARFNDFEMERFDYFFKKIILFLIATLTLLVLGVWLDNIDNLISFTLNSHYNGSIALLTSGFGVHKQPLGIFLGIVILWSLMSWKNLNYLEKSLIFSLLIMLMPMIIGIRTLYLGLGLLGFLLVIYKNKLRVALGFFSLPFILIFLFFYQNDVLVFIHDYYNRWPSLLAAFDVLMDSPYGIGNGGYSIYVENNNNWLLAEYGSEAMNKKGLFWLAPESDLVFFIASWGYFSVFFFGFFAVLTSRALYCLRHKKLKLLPVERVFLAFTVTLIFMGISQDNAGGLTWWIYLGVTVGILLRHKHVRYYIPDKA